MCNVNPASKRLSDLPELSGLLDDDFIVIQRPYIDNESGLSHFKSYKIRYGTLKRYVSSLLSSDLGTMSHCDKELFSKAAHGHDELYNDFWFFPSYGPNSGNTEYKSDVSCIQIGNFNIRKYLPGENQYKDSSINMYIPKSPAGLIDYASSFESNKVGDIQMLAVYDFQSYLTKYRNYQMISYNGIQNIDFTQDSFDGFMIPNGATIQCTASQFKQACRMYSASKSESATSFTLPNFTDFFRANCKSMPLDDDISSVPFHNVVPKHFHSGEKTFTAQSNVTLNFDPLLLSCAIDGIAKLENNTICRGSSSPNAKQCTGKSGNVICQSPELSVLDFSFMNCRITSELTCGVLSSFDHEAYPSHHRIPILIYIGR